MAVKVVYVGGAKDKDDETRRPAVSYVGAGNLPQASSLRAQQTVQMPQQEQSTARQRWAKNEAHDGWTAEDYAAEVARLEQEEKKAQSQNPMLSGLHGAEAKAAGMDLGDWKSAIQDYKNQIENLKAEQWGREQEEKYSGLREKADYKEKSRQVDETLSAKAGMRVFGKYLGSGDETYSYINDLGDGQTRSGEDSKLGGPLAKYAYMTGDEVDDYNYLYQTEGKDAADDYLKYLSYDLNERKAQGESTFWKTRAEEHPVLASAASVPMNLASGLGLVGIAAQNAERDVTGEYQPIDYNGDMMAATRITSAVRGGISQGLADKYGTISLDEEKHPILSRILNGKSLGDVYQLGMSIADSAATAALGGLTGVGAAGTVLLGGAAGSQGVVDALERGATDEQALTMGVLNGAFEALFEYVSLDHLLNGDTKSILKGFLEQGFVEGTEEWNTTLFNTLADIAVMAKNSEYGQNVQRYMDEEGMSQQEAERQAFYDVAIGMGWDFVGGAVSGGLMDAGKRAGSYVMNTAQKNYAAKKAYGGSEQALVDEAEQLQPGSKAAQRVQERINEGKRVSGRDLAALAEQNEAAIQAEDRAKIQSAVENRLVDLGERDRTAQVAEAIARQTAGEDLNRSELDLIENSRYGQRVLNELNPENIAGGGYNTEWAERIGTDRINAEEYSRMLQESENTPERQSAPESETTAVPAAENMQQEQAARQEAPATQAEQSTETTETAETAPKQKPASAESAQTETVDGETGGAATLEDASKRYGKQAGAFIHTYQQEQDVGKYNEAYRAAYDYGRTGVPLDAVKGLRTVSYLTEVQRELAYEAGQAAADQHAALAQEEISRKANGKTGRKKGTVKLEGAPASALNEQQKRATRVMRTIAEATGVDIVLTQSEANEGGVYEGAQGAFKRSSPDKLYIDLNSGLLKSMDASDMAKYSALRTFSHEFTHFIEYWSPVRYNELRKAVFAELTARGENANDLIEAKMDTTGLSYEKASREVVGEAMTDILPDSRFVQNMAQQHKSLFEKLVEKLKEFAADLREYFGTIGANRAREANALKEQAGETLRYVESIVEQFDAAATEAVENFQKAYAEEAVAEKAEKVKERTDGAEKEPERTGDRRPESYEEFEARWKRNGGETRRTASRIYGYGRYDGDIHSIRKAGEIQEGLNGLGIDAFIVDGAIEANNGEYTVVQNSVQAATLEDGSVAIGAAVETGTKETIYHELLHSRLTAGDKAAEDFLRIVNEQFSITEESSTAYYTTIFENYEKNSLKRRQEELAAYISGHIAEGIIDKSMFIDYDAVYEAWERFTGKKAEAAEKSKTTVSPNGYTITDNAEYGSIDVKFEEKPSEAVRDALKQNKFRWNGKRRVWYGKTTHEAISEVLDKVYAAENKTAEEPKSDFAKVWERATQAEKDEVIEAIQENTKLSYVAPTEIREDTKTKREEMRYGESETDEGTVQQPESDGNGAARVLEEVQTEDVQRAGGQRAAVEPDTERGGPAERNGDTADTADRAGGREGNGQSGDIRRDGAELTEGEEKAEKKAKKKQLKETVSRQVEQQSTEKPKGSNFVIGESLQLPSGEKARFQANVEAIRLIKQLETEGRNATAAEQEVLSRYVGWGGLSNAFGEMKWNSTTRKSEMTAKPGWEKEFAELRKLKEDGTITEEEYKAMSASTKNAHYTSVEVIRAMYDGLAKLGFTGGRMLEPSAGVGNFVGGMPAEMSRSVKSWTMVELDRITGQIAKYLYPQADVRIQGFETANLPDNYMDVAIGNVPFGDYGVVDRNYPKRITKAIHNYFFAKTLDKVRPGGVVMFITSSFTMNSQDGAVRQYIMDRADLLGAIRLPNTAFAGNAGTQVVTDILVLKKRAPGTAYGGEAFLSAPGVWLDGKNQPGYWRAAGTFPINEYFTNHPEMVLGTATVEHGMYGANTLTYIPLEGKGTLGEQIRGAFENISGRMDYPARIMPEKANFAVERAGKKTKQLGLEVKEDGKVYRNMGGSLELVSEDKATAERVSGLLGIRDAYRTLVNYLQQGQGKLFIQEARKALNTAYDSFTAKYGLINTAKNKAAIADDPDSYSLLSLENYDAKKKTATKADIFTKDTITPNKTVRHAENVAAGLIVSVNRTGGVDPAMIADLTGKTKEAVTRELIDSRMAFKTRDGGLETPETYLSGNVRAKLREAQALAPMDSDFENNVEELKKVIPKDIPFNDIYTAVGTPWIPNNVYADFIAEMLGGRNLENSYSGPDVTVGRSNSGEFKIVVNDSRLKGRYQNTQKWGTGRKSFLDIMQALMSSTSLRVNDYVEDETGKKKAVLNKVETAAIQEKAEEITKEFQDWLWRDETRRKELSSLYNETFNALVPPKYSGKNLTVNGLNASFGLREHQADAVQRIISSGGNTLLAHRVGAGKTLEMASAAMKMRELGIVKKPVFVVPKSLVAQWGTEFKSYFPGAKLLVSDESSFTKANRKTYANRIANGDYDAVILSYEQFEKIPMSKEFQQKFYQQQIDEIMDAIAEEKAESRSGKGLTVKEMEKKKAQLEKKIAELTSKAKDEDNIDFEQLGIDSLFVDEAHNFKNLQYVTRMNNVSGLGNTNGSQRAFDLYTKIRYLQGLNGGRGIVFATATPVMNSMAEMYIMQKYLQSDTLEQLGLKTFDAWAKQFGEVVNSVEIKPSGQGFRVKQTFSNFRNLNELQMLFRSFSDVLTKVPGLKVPKMKGGKVHVEVCQPGQFQKDYMTELEKRADNVKNVDPSVDNMLKITSDGRKVAYTQRMIDPTLPYEPGCKIFRCCDNVLKEYKESSGIRGTQIVFCDMATPKGKSKMTSNVSEDVDTTEVDTESASLYDDMRAYLVKRGIPEKEIAFIHEANTDAKRKQLFADVNDGKVRVLIGSTGKMGVGMNAQQRMVAIHHLDAPWRPGDVEQRDGRAFRQGNMNEEVAKYTYVTEGSFDARLWDILDRKQHFINQIMDGEDVGRSAEDTGDVTLSAAEVKALASGNPMIMEQVQLSNDLSKLQDLKRAYNSNITAAKAKLLEDGQKIRELESAVEKVRADIRARVDTYSEGNFSMTVGNRVYDEKKDAGAALASAIAAKAKMGEFVTVGKFAGFDLRVMKDGAEFTGLISGRQSYPFHVYTENTTRMVTRLSDTISTLETREQQWTERLAELQADRDAQEGIIAEPFAKQAELEQKTARFNEVMAILNPKEEQVVDVEDDIQQQQRAERTTPLTDREVLSIAAEDVRVEDLTEGEADALRIFKNRLDTLQDLELRRAEEGRKYKEQQFGAHSDRAEAKKTLNRMDILDTQIKRASDAVLDVEQKEVLRRVLQKSRKVVEERERQHGQELLKRYRERRKDAADIKKYRERIQRDAKDLTRWILHPNNKSAYQHVPDALKNSVISVLSSIDMTSKRQLRGGEATKADKEFLKNMKGLRNAIRQNMDLQGEYSGYNDLPAGFMEEMQSFIDTAQELASSQSGQYVLNRMTAQELKSLSKMVRVVKKLVTDMNTFHQNAMFKHTYEAGDNSIDFMKVMQPAKRTGLISDFLLWQQMRPAYAFERFGEGGKAIYDELRRGQAALAFNTRKIVDFAEKTYSASEVKAWEQEQKTFTLGGDEVKIPVSYIMGLYELSKQEDAMAHLLHGGLRVATYKKGLNKFSDVGHVLTQEDVSAITKTLTQRQIEVADAMQKFMATQGADWGNFVSRARFGEDLFTNPLYYPLNSDGRYLEARADEKPDGASLYALLNMSFTKSRVEGANNRLVLYSIFDVFANHMASMAQYNAFALPILDSLKWFNYQHVVKNEDGSKTVLGSVREQMDRVYGTPEESRPGSGRRGYAEDFVIGIIKAFNGTETQGIPTDTKGINAMHKYNMAQVAYNFRVVVQQPMAITRAGMLVDYRNILRGLSLKPSAIQKNIEEMQKYSGIAAWKDLGFYDVNISRGLTDLIKHNETRMEKIGKVGMWGAEKADQITWAAMWNACKEQVQQKQRLRPGDEGFYEAVTKLFEDVVYKTQVVDSVLTKNAFLRSKGAWARLIGSFMSEPTTTASMLMNAYDQYSMDLQRGMTRQQAWKKHGKMIGRTMYVYAIGAVLLAAAESVADAWRDDDDYKTFLEKWLDAFGGNLLDEANPLNKLPILREFYELIKSVLGALGVDTYGNDPRRVIFQWRDYLVKGNEIFRDKIMWEDTNYTWYGGIYKLLQAISGMTGLPMASATREVIGAWNNTVGAMAPSLKAKTYDAGESANIKYAYQDGYLTEEEAVENLVKAGTAREDAEKEVRKWKCKVETGIDNNDLKSAYNSGKITYEQAIEYIMKYRGKTQKEAASQIKQWQDNP